MGNDVRALTRREIKLYGYNSLLRSLSSSSSISLVRRPKAPVPSKVLKFNNFQHIFHLVERQMVLLHLPYTGCCFQQMEQRTVSRKSRSSYNRCAKILFRCGWREPVCSLCASRHLVLWRQISLSS